MSLTYKKRGDKDYLYFQAGTEGTYYIAPKDDPSKVNMEGVEKSLNYALRRLQNYQEIINQLLSYLPEDERRKYLQKEERLRLRQKEIIESSKVEVIQRFEDIIPLAAKSFNSPSVKKIKTFLESLKKEAKEGTKDETK